MLVPSLQVVSNVNIGNQIPPFPGIGGVTGYLFIHKSAVCGCDISWPYSVAESTCLIFEVKLCICYNKYLAVHVSVIIFTLKRVAFDEAMLTLEVNWLLKMKHFC